MKNFKELTENYTIEIPIVQRDYVQGRDDEKAEEVRKGFLDDIFIALKNDKLFPLDFVYGSFEKEKFIPIDGQQRLTTLLLLYWYFSKKEKKNFSLNFTYKTRVSSRSFTEILFKFDINFSESGQDCLKEQFLDSKEFIPFWENDPTIKSMLVVIDEIHLRGKELNLFDKLENITFEVFELKDFGKKQSEELYRKMNSRGKSLTHFENFKAIIEQILYKQHSQKKYKEIARKFEKEWVDNFWINYKSTDYLIDDSFMNFVYCFTEMLSFEKGKDNKEEVKKFYFLKEFYQDKENLDLLILALDNFKNIENFSIKLEKEFTFFEKNNNFNLLQEILNNYSNSTITNKILFYIIIKGDFHRIEDKIFLVRMARNILYRYRALRRAGSIEYTLTLDYKDITNLLNNFNKLMNNPYQTILNINYTDKNFAHEKTKAKFLQSYPQLDSALFKLEDFKYLKGDLRLFFNEDFKFKELDKRIEFLSNNLISIFNSEDTLIIRALLSIDDYSLWIGSVNKGGKFFFGQKNKWEIFLTQNPKSSEKVKIYSNFFEVYEKSGTLNEMIKLKLSTYMKLEKDWIYYFIKYSIITKSENNLSNVIGWFNYNNDDTLEKLENEKRITNWHVNIYLLALLSELKIKINNESIVIDEKNATSCLIIKNKKIEVINDCIIYNKISFPLFENDDAIEILKKLIK